VDKLEMWALMEHRFHMVGIDALECFKGSMYVQGGLAVVFILRSGYVCFSPFKKHLELELSDSRVAELLEGKAKFKTEVHAAGLPTGRWLSNISTFPKVVT